MHKRPILKTLGLHASPWFKLTQQAAASAHTNHATQRSLLYVFCMYAHEVNQHTEMAC